MQVIEAEPRWFGYRLDSNFKQIRLVIISDAHYGNPLFSKKHFLRTIQYVGDNDDCFAMLNGDLAESSIRTSKGEIYSQVGSPQQQRDWLAEEALNPIRHKILGADKGNHEDRIWREVGIDISADIAKALGIPYRPSGILVKIQFGHGNNRQPDKPFVFWIYCTHGYGGARTKSAKAVKVERTSTWLHADAYCMSHDHVVNAAPNVYLMPDNRGTIDPKTGFTSGKLTQHREMLVKTNAYLKWGGYSEFYGFPPTDLYTPIIWLLTPQSDYWNLFPEKPTRTVRVMV